MFKFVHDSDTLDCLINVGSTRINFWTFFHPYDLIWKLHLLFFQFWNMPMFVWQTSLNKSDNFPPKLLILLQAYV